jgi:hypothetical protein
VLIILASADIGNNGSLIVNPNELAQVS